MLRFSVVIPTYNRKDVLRQCLRGLAAQTYPAHEVLVVDGGRDDTPAMLAAEFPTYRYLRDDRSGPSAARNMGWQNASGEIVAFTDDDCLAPPDWLARLADGFERHPEVCGVAGRCEPPESVWRRNIFARHEVWISWHVYGLTPDRPEYLGGGLEVPGATNNVAYRREILAAIGGFSTQFRAHIAGEERELRDRLGAHGYNRYLYVPVKLDHLREYNFRGFLTQMLEQALGVNRHWQRIARGESARLPAESRPRWRIPGLAPAWAARDGALVGVLLLERLVYGLARLLPEAANLWLIRAISKL